MEFKMTVPCLPKYRLVVDHVTVYITCLCKCAAPYALD